MAFRFFGTDSDNYKEPPLGLSREGVVSGKGISSKIFNWIINKIQADHVLGSASQLALNDCTIKWDNTAQDYLDKNDVPIVFSSYDRISIVGSDTLTANMTLPSITGLIMRSINGAQLQLGVNAGDGNAPFKIISDDSTSRHDIDIETDKLFEELDYTLTDDRKRYFANQGRKNKITVNGKRIYDPSNVGNIITKQSIPFDNPYLARINGQQLHYKLHLTPATNNTLAWFRDLNAFEGGLRDSIETASRHTLVAIIAASPHIFQMNTINGMLRELSTVDPDIHSRTDQKGTSIAATADFDGVNPTVTFDSSIGNIKEGMRIQGTGVPGSTTDTTIIVNIVGLTATTVNALDGSPVVASVGAGVAVTLDNSGAAGGSKQDDAMQRVTGEWGARNDPISRPPNGVFFKDAGSYNTQLAGGTTLGPAVFFDNSGSTSPNQAKSNDDESRVKTTGAIYYQQA